jgi:thiol-disulfide isomerase/thioredoxin
LDASKPWSPTAVAREIDHAIATRHPIAGPSLAKSLDELETREGRAAPSAVTVHGPTLVFDYWAGWCVPCKVLEKALLQWQSAKPAGSVQIVKAETDIMKAMRATGEKTYMITKGADGKLHKTEMR